jgi:hypothetical protein
MIHTLETLQGLNLGELKKLGTKKKLNIKYSNKWNSRTDRNDIYEKILAAQSLQPADEPLQNEVVNRANTYSIEQLQNMTNKTLKDLAKQYRIKKRNNYNNESLIRMILDRQLEERSGSWTDDRLKFLHISELKELAIIANSRVPSNITKKNDIIAFIGPVLRAQQRLEALHVSFVVPGISQLPADPIVQLPVDPIIQLPVDPIVQLPVDPIIQLPVDPIIIPPTVEDCLELMIHQENSHELIMTQIVRNIDTLPIDEQEAMFKVIFDDLADIALDRFKPTMIHTLLQKFQIFTPPPEEKEDLFALYPLTPPEEKEEIVFTPSPVVLNQIRKESVINVLPLIHDNDVELSENDFREQTRSAIELLISS